MAFVTPPISPEEENQFAPSGVTTPNPAAQAPPQASETGGSAGTGTVGGAAPSQATPTQFGSNASKLSDYLAANADQTQTMGNQIAGNLSSQFGQVQGDVTNAGQAVADQVESGTPHYDPSLVGQFQQNPTDFAAKPENVSAFQKSLNASYTGPDNFETSPAYSNVQKEVQGAVQNAGLVNSYPGLSTYLQNNTKGTYTPGMNTLDTVLLQGNQPAYKAVTDAAKPYAGLSQYLTDTGAQVNAAVPKAQQAAQDTKAQTQAAYQGVANPFVAGLNDTYAKGTQGSIDYNKQLNDIAAKISNGNFAGLTPEEQSLIGFNSKVNPLIDQYASIFPTQAQDHPINFSNFFTQGPQAKLPNASNLMTPDKIAEYQALTNLSGAAPTGLNFDMPASAVPIEGQTGSQPGVLPAYSNTSALGAIDQAYRPFYNAALNNGFVTQPGGNQAPLSQPQIDYMNSLSGAEGTPQPGAQPTSAPPASGSNGDLGAGFHWDTASASWVPTIPLAPPGGGVSSGGGRATR